MSEIQVDDLIVAMPPNASDWMYTAMKVWTDKYGGEDASYLLPEGDEFTWVGDVQVEDGRVLRLNVDRERGVVSASDVEVVLLPENYDHTELDRYVWTGMEWLAEYRSEDQIIADCADDCFFPDRFVSRIVTSNVNRGVQ